MYKILSMFYLVKHDFFDMSNFICVMRIFLFFTTGYDGPMQFLMSPVNPDQVIPLQTNRISTYDGKFFFRAWSLFCWLA